MLAVIRQHKPRALHLCGFPPLSAYLGSSNTFRFFHKTFNYDQPPVKTQNSEPLACYNTNADLLGTAVYHTPKQVPHPAQPDVRALAAATLPNPSPWTRTNFYDYVIKGGLILRPTRTSTYLSFCNSSQKFFKTPTNFSFLRTALAAG
ncbi:hypothetical protein C8F04DRAFT_1267291 [Mycena alexandri]|uniref:Uncharacterized protein n=1 Tax=Mycena alexandri TaxID=1745969 RepID=A0AAD6SGK2_9AGAR|nr:hypothetical protein C8F04DRAFT_1267291 [Mycena alexandri]